MKTVRHRGLVGRAVLLCGCAMLLIESANAAMIAHWKFDELSGETVADSVGSHAGTLSPSGANFAPDGVDGGALRLSRASNGYVSMGPVLALDSDHFSISVWIKTDPNDRTDASVILSKYEIWSSEGYYLNANTLGGQGELDKVMFRDGGATSANVVSETSINDGQWHHVVVVRDAGGNKVIFVDGIPAEDTASSLPISNVEAPFVVGGLAAGGSPFGFYTGMIDDLRIYDHALSEDEIVLLHESPGAIPDQCVTMPSIVSWWPGEGDMQDVKAGHDASIIGGVAVGEGRVGMGFHFDGSGELWVPHNPDYSLRKFTMEAWVFPTALDGEVEIILNKESPPVQFALGIRGPVNHSLPSGGAVPVGNLAFFIGGLQGLPSDYVGWVDGKAEIPLNEWTHVAMAFDGSEVAVFVDGEVTRKITGLTGDPMITPGRLRIGSRSSTILAVLPNERFNGRIDEVTLYSQSLSAEQIRSIVEAGAAGKCPIPAVQFSLPTSGFRESLLVEIERLASTEGTIRYTLDGTDPTAASSAYAEPFSITSTTNLKAQLFVDDAPASKIVSVTYVRLDEPCSLAEDLVAWWPGDQGGTELVGGHHGQLLGGTTTALGRVGEAFAFDGLDDRVVVEANGALDVGAADGFTLDAWIFPTGHTAAGPAGSGPILEWDAGVHLWQTHSRPDRQRGLYVNVVDSTGRFHVLEVSNAVQQRQWNHVAVRYSKESKVLTLYVNGEPVGSRNIGAITPQTTGDFYIGWRPGGSFQDSRAFSFNGLIDEISVYKSALSDAQIRIRYAAAAHLKDSAVAWWPGDFHFRDVKSGVRAHSFGDVSFGAGQVGAAFSFDGDGDGVTANASAALDVGLATGFSMEAWIFPKGHTATAAAGSGPILEWEEGVHLWQTHFAPDRLHGYYVNVVDNEGAFHVVQMSNSIVQGEWNHLLVTYAKADGVLTLYRNGAKTISRNIGTFTPATSGKFHIGWRPAGSFDDERPFSFNGSIDEAVIYDRVLTEREALNNYLSGALARCAPIFPLADGIPAEWRIEHFGENYWTDPRAAAIADPDQDGANNFQEFVTGTDPLDAESVNLEQPLLALLPAGGEFTNSVAITAKTVVTNATVRYTLDGTEPDGFSAELGDELFLDEAAQVNARLFVNNAPISSVVSETYIRVYAIDDGIPATWREQFFGPEYRTDPRVAADADPDEDGAANLQEFLAGTNPTNPRSGFFVGVRAVPVITWQAVPGRAYRVIRRENPFAQDEVLTPFITATNSTMRHIDIEAPHAQSVYVIEVQTAE